MQWNKLHFFLFFIEQETTSPSSPHEKSEAVNKENKHLRKIVHSKSLDDLSPEEDRAKKYESSPGSGGPLTSSESFNNFQYWREPLPVLDDLVTSDDLKTLTMTEAENSEDHEAASEKSSEDVSKTSETASASSKDNAVSEKKGM